MCFKNDRELYSTIGKNIKKYRMAAGFTQARFSDMLGISISYLTKIEAANCDKSLSLSLLNHIANTLSIEITKFFEGED